MFAIVTGASLTAVTLMVWLTTLLTPEPAPVWPPSSKVNCIVRTPETGSSEELWYPNALTSALTTVGVASAVRLVTLAEPDANAMSPIVLPPKISEVPLTENPDEPRTTIWSPVWGAVIATVNPPPEKSAGLSASVRAPEESGADGAPFSV